MGLFDTIQTKGQSQGQPKSPANGPSVAADGAPIEGGGWRAPFGRAANLAIIGITALAALLIGVDRLVDLPLLQRSATTLYLWMMLIAAAALLLGVVNVVGVHLRRIAAGRSGWLQSLALLIALFVVFVTGMLGSSGVDSTLTRWMFDSIIAPGQAALFSLLAFFMAAAAYRFLNIGRNGGAWMLAGALATISVQLPRSGPAAELSAVVVGWFADVVGMATVRGALLGSTVALVVVGLRYLVRAR